MAKLTRSGHVFELKPGAGMAGDAAATAEILAAYFAAEQSRARRRLVWRWLAPVLLACVAAGAALHSAGLLESGIGLIAAIGAVPAVAERRAERRLRGFLPSSQ